MDPLVVVLVVLVFLGVLALVGLPLRSEAAEAADERERRDIEAVEEAKSAKYREIRELEMDFRTGKLTPEDFRAQDRERRAEAVVLLRRLDALGAAQPRDEAPAVSLASRDDA